VPISSIKTRVHGAVQLRHDAVVEIESTALHITFPIHNVHIWSHSISSSNIPNPYPKSHVCIKPNDSRKQTQAALEETKSSNLCSNPFPSPSLDHSPPTPPSPSTCGMLDVLSPVVDVKGLMGGGTGDLEIFGLTVPGRWSGES
jgi:hypothetical protein